MSIDVLGPLVVPELPPILGLPAGDPRVMAEVREWNAKRRMERLRERLEPRAVVLEPPISPNRKAFPFVASCTFRGIPIDIEQRKGDVREGVDRDGTPWRVEMQAHYGEIRSHARGAPSSIVAGARGLDGDRLDCYVGPDADSDLVVVIDQLVRDTGAMDEQKVMLGWASTEDAIACYRKQYDDPRFLGPYVTMTVDEFKAKIGDKTNAGKALTRALASLVRRDSLMKAMVPIGTVHTWADGHSYRKTVDGWTPVEGAHTWHGKVGEKMVVPYGDGSPHATHYEIAEERHHEGRDEVKVTSHAGTPHGSSHGPWIPKASARHFHDDLKGVVRGPKDAPHPAIQSVLEGKAKLLGKGDDGIAFKAGDKVVKASTTVPFQPMNNGHLTPKAAANRLVHQGQVSEHLRGLGVPGLMPIETYRHGDKAYHVRDHVEIPEKLSKEHLDQAAATVHAMHERGWKLGDDVQVGLHQGKAVLYDTGKATKMKHPDDRSWRGEREDDHARLASLYKQHGHVYQHPDAGRRASDRWNTVVGSAMRADKNHDFHIRHLKEGLAAMVKAHGEGSEEAKSAQDEHDVLVDMLKEHAAGLTKGGNPGPYIGPQGGKWADPAHTIPWHVHIVTAHHDPQHAGKRVHLYHHPVTGRVHFQSADYAGNVGSFPPAALHITKHGVIERGTGAVLAVPEAQEEDPMNKAGWLELPEAHGRWAYLAMLCKGRVHKYFKRVPTGKFTKTGRPKYRYFYHVARGGSIGAKDHMVVVTDKDGKTHGASFMADGGHWHITHADGDRLTVKHDESGETKEMSKGELAAKLYAEHGEALAQHAKALSERTDRERAETAEHGSDAQRTRVGLPTKAEEKAKKEAKEKADRIRDEQTQTTTATKNSMSLTHWQSLVFDHAHAKSKKSSKEPVNGDWFREKRVSDYLHRAYNAGEPAKMAADTVHAMWNGEIQNRMEDSDGMAAIMRAARNAKPPSTEAPASKPTKPVERDAAGDPKMATLDGKIEAVGDHIWGSRKDLANKRHIDSSKDLEGMGYTDAAAIVSKANLVTPLALEDAKAMGMSPGTAYMFMDLLGAIRQKPDDSAAGRAAYVDDIRSIQGAMTRVKTLADFDGLIEGMRQRRRAAPKYTTVFSVENEGLGHEKAVIAAKIEELRKDNPHVKYMTTVDRQGRYNPVRGIYESKTNIVIDAPLPYDQLGAKITGLLDRGKAARASHSEALHQASQLDNGKSVGHGAASSFAVQRSPTADGMTPEQAWAWLNASTAQAKKVVVTKPKAPKPEANTEKGFSEAKADAYIEAVRIGGKEIPGEAKSERVKNTFNLREVGYGDEDYMKQADRAYHTKALEGALHDLSDALGLDPKSLSFNGRLGVAMGARGRGGKAAAHYETGRAVINMTKFAGGGFLAHEWGHALDNIIASHHIASSLGASDGDTYLTRTPEHSKMPKELSAHAKAVIDAMFKHPDPVRARAEHAAELTKLRAVEGDLVSKNNALVREHEALKRKPTTTEARDKQVAAKQNNVETWKKELQSFAEGKKSNALVMQRMSNLTHWISQTNRDIASLQQSAVSGPEIHARMEAVKAEIEALRTPINKASQARRTMEKVDPTASVYQRESAVLDKGGKKPYWSSPQEMFARAFDHYVHTKLAAQGRKNTYLTSSHDDSTGQPFPKGEEAAKIHAAMDGLFAHINKSGDLAKALRTLIGAAPLAKAIRTDDGSWWVPVSVAIGEAGCASDLAKGASHRYFRKVPTGNPRHPWRYYYRATAGGGMGNHAHMQAGAAFKGTSNGSMGHFHVQKVHGDGHVTIHHDESGVTEKIHRNDLAKRLEAEHAKGIEVEHKMKARSLDRQHAEAVQHGSPMQAAKLRADADKAHVAASDARKRGRDAEPAKLTQRPSEPAEPAKVATRVEPQRPAPSEPEVGSRVTQPDPEHGRDIAALRKRYADAEGKAHTHHFTHEETGTLSHATFTPGEKGRGTVHVHRRTGKVTEHKNVPHWDYHNIVEADPKKHEGMKEAFALMAKYPDAKAAQKIAATKERIRTESRARRVTPSQHEAQTGHWALTEKPTLLKALMALGRMRRRAA